VIIPTHPGVFSAWGMLMTDLRQDLVRTAIRRTDRIEPAALTGLFAEMEAQARRNLQAQGVSESQILFQRFADMRYKGQEHTVKVPFPAGEIGPAQMPEIDERFHHLHQQAYTFRLETSIELVNYHLSAFGVVDKADLQKLAPAHLTLAAAQKGERRVNFDELGFQTAAIYERDRLPLNTVISGPLVIEEPTSTTVVFPDQQVVRDEYGFLHIELLEAGFE